MILLLASCVAATPCLAASVVIVSLRPEARVSEGQVTLGDIAHLESGDLSLMRRLVDLPVGQAPQPGQAAVVQREALEAWVRRTTGLAGDALRWSGAASGRVVRASRVLRGEEIAQAAMEGARHGLAAAGQHGDVDVRQVPRDVDVPEGRLRLQPRPMEAGYLLRTRTLVWVDAWAGERFVRSFPVTVDIAGLGGSPLVVPPSATAPAPSPTVADTAVSRGEWASLRTTSGAVSLESRVEVLQDGRVGQKVRVRSGSGATGVLSARVVGRGQLELAP